MKIAAKMLSLHPIPNFEELSGAPTILLFIAVEIKS